MLKQIRKICIVAVLGMIAAGTVAQMGKGVISGSAKDAAGAALQGANIRFAPPIRTATTDAQGEFTITDVTPGVYTVTVSYVGFNSYEGSVTVANGQTAKVLAVLDVASRNDSVIVTADRPHGEAEAINRTRAAENILQVLPAEVITSLPNANIADALGRMASVTIERDEGEGKYVQIRGTEPRLSNTMIDGVTVPSSGIRCTPDQARHHCVRPGGVGRDQQDAAGQHRRRRHRRLGKPGDQDGRRYTNNGLIRDWRIHAHHRRPRTVDQIGGTIGRRYGESKKLGALVGGTYDYNGRGINDIEPVSYTR